MNTKTYQESIRRWKLHDDQNANGINLWDEEEPLEFQFGEEECYLKPWKQDEIPDDFVAVDTETLSLGDELEEGKVPDLVVAQASGLKPSSNYIIHPRDLPSFLRMHRGKHLVFFHLGFDFGVFQKYLEQIDSEETAGLLWEMLDGGQLHDLMLLDQLVRLGEGRGLFHRRSLAHVAAETIGLELEKEDSPRLRYDELLRRDYQGIDPEFYEYAARDARATRLAFDPLWRRANEIHKYHVQTGEADQNRSRPWAPLTEQIQVRGAVALAEMRRRGVRVDVERLARLTSEASEELFEAVAAFEQLETVENFEKACEEWLFRHREDGELELTKTGAPSRRSKLIRELFQVLCRRNGEQPPLTQKGLVSLSHEGYIGTGTLEKEPTLKCYFRIQDQAALFAKLQELREHTTKDHTIHTDYVTLVKTGRTKCRNPQVQNLPRDGGMRECIVPREGYIFYGADYSSIELVALASICRQRYGYSRLGDRIEQGEDPHTFTASQILGKAPEEVTKQERQAAKVYNFGVPGGMRAKALAHQAEVAYDIRMSQNEASLWRERLIREVYPEIGQFLDDFLERFAEDALGIPAEELVDALIETTEADSFSSDAREWVLSSAQRLLRTGMKANGEPYAQDWAVNIWAGLRKAYLLSRSKIGSNAEIERALKNRLTGPGISRLFFPTRAVTLTGRVRMDVNFREGHNTPFQGLAADGAKLALYRLIREGFHPVLFLHDEVVVELPGDVDREKVRSQIDRILIEEMQQVIPDVPVRVEGKFMARWEK